MNPILGSVDGPVEHCAVGGEAGGRLGHREGRWVMGLAVNSDIYDIKKDVGSWV